MTNRHCRDPAMIDEQLLRVLLALNLERAGAS
jgi:hypothetical protein